MDPTSIGVIGTTLSAFFVAFFGWLGVRDKRTRDMAEKADKSIDELRDDMNELRADLDAAIGYAYDLRRLMIAADISPPELPSRLVNTKG